MLYDISYSMTNQEQHHVGYTPKVAAFGEAAAMVRELVKQGLMSKKEALRITEMTYRATMLAQSFGHVDIGSSPEELPEYLKIFPGATNPDGSVNFSSSKHAPLM